MAIAYGAGLATGLARFPDPTSVGVAALAGVLLSRRLPLRSGAAVFLIGLLVAVPVRWWSSTSCAARIDSGRASLRVELIDPGAGIGRVRPLGIGCHGSITARWPDARAIPAGVQLELAGRWLARPGALGRPDGMLYVDRIGPPVGSPGWLAKSRNVVADRSGRLFGKDAPLVDALVAGRRGALPEELVDSFVRTGLVHLLVISGSHIGVVAGWVALVVVLLGLPRRWGGQAGALAAICYAAWLGWPAPATRAAVLILILTWGRLLQRRWRPSGALGGSALVVLLIDPWAMTRLGAWLSFVAVAGVLWATRWSRRAWPRRLKWREAIAASVGATLTTAPIAAWGFGRVAPVGIILNLVAIPLAAVAVPALGGALLLDSLLPELARAFAAAGTVLLHLMVGLGRWGSSLPGTAAREGSAGIVAALPWLLVLAIAWLATRRGAAPGEAARRFAWSAAAFGWLALARPVGQPLLPAGQLVLTFLDVGQGDATAIRTPGGHWLLVDAGPADDRYDAGARVVVPYLRRLGVERLDLMAISHAHRDHAGGAAAVLSAIPVGVMIDPGEPVAEAGYRDLLEQVAANRTRWQVVSAGTAFEVDGVSFRVVHPLAPAARGSRDLNEESIVLEVRWRDFSALLAGDAGILAESSYVARIGSLDLLKVGHHGSRSATGLQLLRHSPPDAAVISLGLNHYGHPAPELLARLATAGVALWRTDQEGPVTLTTDGHTFTLRGERTTRTFAAADP